MRINPNSLHAKIYRLDLEMAGYGKARQEFRETDLCSYMRRVCIFFPLRILVRTALMVGALGAIWLPLFSPSPWVGLTAIGLLALAVGAVLALIFLVVIGTLFWENEVRPYITRRRAESVSPLVAWFRAKKQGICPLVTISTDEETPDA